MTFVITAPHVLTATLALQANEAGWAGRDYEEGTIKKVPSLKPSERPPSIGRRPIKARRGALEAGHVQEQTPDMHLRVSPSVSS